MKIIVISIEILLFLNILSGLFEITNDNLQYYKILFNIEFIIGFVISMLIHYECFIGLLYSQDDYEHILHLLHQLYNIYLTGTLFNGFLQTSTINKYVYFFSMLNKFIISYFGFMISMFYRIDIKLNYLLLSIQIFIIITNISIFINLYLLSK